MNCPAGLPPSPPPHPTASPPDRTSVSIVTFAAFERAGPCSDALPCAVGRLPHITHWWSLEARNLHFRFDRLRDEAAVVRLVVHLGLLLGRRALVAGVNDLRVQRDDGDARHAASCVRP